MNENTEVEEKKSFSSLNCNNIHFFLSFNDIQPKSFNTQFENEDSPNVFHLLHTQGFYFAFLNNAEYKFIYLHMITLNCLFFATILPSTLKNNFLLLTLNFAVFIVRIK
jgi:hypothetical protein